MSSIRNNSTWTDAKRRNARTSWYEKVTTGGSLTDIENLAISINDAILNISNCELYTFTFAQTPPDPALAGTNAEFPNVEDKAVFTFVATDFSLHRYQIPAPKASIFYADGETVNPAQTDVAAFINVMIAGDGSSLAEVCNASGTAGLAEFVGGIRLRRKMQRRLNIRVKDPLLTGPAE